MTIRATISKLRGLYDKATPGKWYPMHNMGASKDCDYVCSDSDIFHESLVADMGHPRMHDTAAFIAEAHNALPALLEYIERLEHTNSEIARRAQLAVDMYRSDREATQDRIKKLERVAEAAKAFVGPSYPWHGSDPHRKLTQALEELDALDSEAFDRRNFTYSNDGRSVTILNTDDSVEFDPKDVKLITKP